MARYCALHCFISCSKRILSSPLRYRTYMSIASRAARLGQCCSRHARKSLFVRLMLPIAMILRGKGLGGAVPVLSSVADFTIPLVSSVRIGLASRILFVQANTGSFVVGEPEWGGRSSAGAVCKRTDERDAIDKRVKEMKKKREDPFFSPTIFSSISYVFKLKLSYWLKIHQIRFFFSFLFFLITF